MSAKNEKFAGAVWCMDGRDKKAVQDYAQGLFVDSVCDGPGTVGVLADVGHPKHALFVQKLRDQLPVSIGNHGSEIIFVSGHAECAGHPVDDVRHKEDILKATALVRSILHELNYTTITVIPLWNQRGEDGVWFLWHWSQSLQIRQLPQRRHKNQKSVWHETLFIFGIPRPLLLRCILAKTGSVT
tara:strand:- start:2686 stop:3240 length:555 start_codon:yes stop_codon:yes gene_type:complete